MLAKCGCTYSVSKPHKNGNRESSRMGDESKNGHSEGTRMRDESKNGHWERARECVTS